MIDKKENYYSKIIKVLRLKGKYSSRLDKFSGLTDAEIRLVTNAAEKEMETKATEARTKTNKRIFKNHIAKSIGDMNALRDDFNLSITMLDVTKSIDRTRKDLNMGLELVRTNKWHYSEIKSFIKTTSNNKGKTKETYKNDEVKHFRAALYYLASVLFLNGQRKELFLSIKEKRDIRLFEFVFENEKKMKS